MSEQKIDTVAGGTDTGKSRQSVQSFQHIWMAHWMQPGSRHWHGNKEFDCVSRGHNMKNGSKSSRPIIESGVIETGNLEIASSKCDQNKTEGGSHVKHGQITYDKHLLRGVFGHNIKQDKTICSKGETQFSFAIPAMNEASFRRGNSAGEGSSKGLPELMKTHSSAIDTINSSHGPKVESSKQIVPYYGLNKCEFDEAQKEFDKEKALLIMKYPIFSMDQFTNSTMRMLEQENCYKHGQLVDFFDERQFGRHSDAAMDARCRDLDTFLSLDTPSTSHHHLPTLGQAWLQKMQNHSSCGTFPSQGILSDKIESNKPYCNCYSLQKLPYCVHNMQRTRICATVNSMEATPEGFPRFYQTRHSALIKKEVDLSKENDDFRTAELVAEMNRNASDIHCISPFLGQVKRRVELQSLSGSYKSEGKRDNEGVTVSKVRIENESSAETDTLDVDLFKEETSNSGGANHTTTVKSINTVSMFSPRTNATSRGNIRWLGKKAVPPDSNQELPALSAAASSFENVCPTSSRAQTLDIDVNKLPLHSDYSNKKSDISPRGSSEADPTMRWVKRLKLKSPNSSSHGTKSSKLSEHSSPDERRKFLKKILETDTTNSESPSTSHRAEETIMLGKSRGKDFMEGSTKKGKESLLSQTWIKRWLRRGSKVTKKKPLMVVCEPQSFKLTLDNFQKKLFPSIAAMALIGKAVNGLHLCELQKQDSFTIWNTKAF